MGQRAQASTVELAYEFARTTKVPFRRRQRHKATKAKVREQAEESLPSPAFLPSLPSSFVDKELFDVRIVEPL